MADARRRPKNRIAPADPRHPGAAGARHELGEGADGAAAEADDRRRWLHAAARRRGRVRAGRPTTGRTRTTRRAASFPSKDMGLPAPYTIYDKAEVWAENSADLYEIAIKEQWKPATQISWSTHRAARRTTSRRRSTRSSPTSRSRQYNSNQVLMGWLEADLVRLPRGQALPGDAGLRPRAARRGVPQARARERRRPRRADADVLQPHACTRRSSSPSSSST